MPTDVFDYLDIPVERRRSRQRELAKLTMSRPRFRRRSPSVGVRFYELLAECDPDTAVAQDLPAALLLAELTNVGLAAAACARRLRFSARDWRHHRLSST